MGRKISPSVIQSRQQRAEPQLRIPLVAKQGPVHPDLAGVSTNHCKRLKEDWLVKVMDT